ncbi:peptidase dimerization domain-containing protein, partial [Acinetobacter baumannii]
VGTIGEIKIDNPSRNVIPGDLTFTVDIRSSESATLDKLHDAIQTAAAEIATRRKVSIDLQQIWRKEPTVFDKKLVDAVEAATRE